MQNAADSPRLRPALAGLTLILLAAASPAAGQDAQAPATGGVPRLQLAEHARHIRPDRRSVWPTAVRLRLRAYDDMARDEMAPFGLAVRLAEGLSLGAAGSFDPASGESIGVISFELAF